MQIFLPLKGPARVIYIANLDWWRHFDCAMLKVYSAAQALQFWSAFPYNTNPRPLLALPLLSWHSLAYYLGWLFANPNFLRFAICYFARLIILPWAGKTRYNQSFDLYAIAFAFGWMCECTWVCVLFLYNCRPFEQLDSLFWSSP